jgi:Flp pilus assembly protein TadD
MPHSGFLKADGMLDESAHVYKAILLDESGRHITRHQIWTTNVKAYDNTIQAGRSDVARFRFRLPDGAAPQTGKSSVKKTLSNSSLTLRARMNYRRVNQEYTNYILKQRNRKLTLPVIKMAQAETRLQLTDKPSNERAGSANAKGQPTVGRPQWKRWNDYGIGLLEQAQYGAASMAFRRASQLAPENVSLLVNAAIAEMRSERFGPEREQFNKAAALLEEALKIAPDNLRARYFQALVWRGQGKYKEAADVLADVARQYPRDREVQRQLGQTLYSLGRLVEARSALEVILSIDPTDALAYQLLSPLYESEGRQAESKRALDLYYQWRDDPRADAIAARFFAAHPEWADERVTSHTHGKASASRPVLIGTEATPER